MKGPFQAAFLKTTNSVLVTAMRWALRSKSGDADTSVGLRFSRTKFRYAKLEVGLLSPNGRPVAKATGRARRKISRIRFAINPSLGTKGRHQPLVGCWKTRKHRCLWATRPVFVESMFSSARRPRDFQVDVDPVDNFESSSTGVRADSRSSPGVQLGRGSESALHAHSHLQSRDQRERNSLWPFSASC